MNRFATDSPAIDARIDTQMWVANSGIRFAVHPVRIQPIHYAQRSLSLAAQAPSTAYPRLQGGRANAGEYQLGGEAT